MKRIVIIAALALGFASCNHTAPEAEQATEVSAEERVSNLKKEVMEVHDKTMAQMGEMNKLRKQLKETQTQVADTSAHYNAYNDLMRAQEDMMDWMRNFENPDEMEISEEEKAQYLEEQKQKISDLSEYTDRSIEKARAVVGNQ